MPAALGRGRLPATAESVPVIDGVALMVLQSLTRSSPVVLLVQVWEPKEVTCLVPRVGSRVPGRSGGEGRPSEWVPPWVRERRRVEQLGDVLGEARTPDAVLGVPSSLPEARRLPVRPPGPPRAPPREPRA